MATIPGLRQPISNRSLIGQRQQATPRSRYPDPRRDVTFRFRLACEGRLATPGLTHLSKGREFACGSLKPCPFQLKSPCVVMTQGLSLFSRQQRLPLLDFSLSGGFSPAPPAAGSTPLADKHGGSWPRGEQRRLQ